MDVREKLVELIDSVRYWGCGTSEEIAKNLIANGVTVQGWISVNDRLPEDDQWVLCFMGDEDLTPFRTLQWNSADWRGTMVASGIMRKM